MNEITKIERWKLTQLIGNLYSTTISGLEIIGFKIHEGGVSKLLLTPSAIREIKTLSAQELQWYKDVYLRREHVAVQVEINDRLILVAFFADDMQKLRQRIAWVNPQTPEIVTSRLMEI